MAIALFGASSTTVLAYLKQWQVTAATAPGTDVISDGGAFLMRAAARVAGALRDGGYGVPTATTETNPEAYWILQGLISELAALYFAQGVSQIVAERDPLAESRKRVELELGRIADGGRIGELVPSDSEQAGYIYTGEYTEDDIEVSTFTYSDEL